MPSEHGYGDFSLKILMVTLDMSEKKMEKEYYNQVIDA